MTSCLMMMMVMMTSHPIIVIIIIMNIMTLVWYLFPKGKGILYDDEEGWQWFSIFATVDIICICMYLLPKGTGIVYEAEIIHFEHKREPSFLTTAAVFQPLFSEQNFSSHFRSVKNLLPKMTLRFGHMIKSTGRGKKTQKSTDPKFVHNLLLRDW